MDLFKAVDRWAPKEMERQGLTPDGVVKRSILGEEIVKAIRFLEMSQKEFASVFVDCDILTNKEISFMMDSIKEHYSGVGLESSLPLMHSPRRTGLFVSSFNEFCNSHMGMFIKPIFYFAVRIKFVCKLGATTNIYERKYRIQGQFSKSQGKFSSHFASHILANSTNLLSWR